MCKVNKYFQIYSYINQTSFSFSVIHCPAIKTLEPSVVKDVLSKDLLDIIVCLLIIKHLKNAFYNVSILKTVAAQRFS